MCEIQPISLTSLNTYNKREILKNIKTQDKSNIPTCYEEITSSWIRMVLNQYQIRKEKAPFPETEEIKSLKGVNCKHNAGKLSSVYLLNIQIDQSSFDFVAKFLPPDDNSIVEACSNNVFEKEISIYFDLLPAIKCHVSESITNMIPEVIYASHNENGAGVMVFKSCEMDGYSACENPDGLMPCQLEIAIESLAKFHAYASKFIEDATLDAVLERYEFLSLKPNIQKQFFREDTPSMDSELEAQFLKVFCQPGSDALNNRKFLTIIHGEYWEPNLMFDDSHGMMQILDWKHARLGSGIFDLAFLLGSHVLEKEELNKYLEFYFEAYSRTCSRVKHTLQFTLKELHEEYEDLFIHQVAKSVASALKKEIIYLNNGKTFSRRDKFKQRVVMILSKMLA